jgi:hypothetical protein
MKKSLFLTFLTVFYFCASIAFAAEEMKTYEMQMKHGDHAGKLIRETVVDGYHLSYHLIDMQAQMKDMQGMQHNMQEMASHHLMLYIQDAEGKNIDSANVGYLVVSPDGTEQKVMTMAMSGAYGADINMPKQGEYTIKCKAVVQEKKLLDEFKFNNN